MSRETRVSRGLTRRSSRTARTTALNPSQNASNRRQTPQNDPRERTKTRKPNPKPSTDSASARHSRATCAAANRGFDVKGGRLGPERIADEADRPRKAWRDWGARGRRCGPREGPHARANRELTASTRRRGGREARAHSRRRPGGEADAGGGRRGAPRETRDPREGPRTRVNRELRELPGPGAREDRAHSRRRRRAKPKEEEGVARHGDRGRQGRMEQSRGD